MRYLGPFLALVLVVAVALGISAGGLVPAEQRPVPTVSSEETIVITFDESDRAAANAASPTTVPPPAGASGASSPPSPGGSTTSVVPPTTTAEAPSEQTETQTAPDDEATAVTYTVQEGDTPADIADQVGVSVAELMAANGIEDPTELQIGTALVVPASE